MTKSLESLDADKASAIAGASYPIDGLAVTDDGVALQGIPFSQASSAEKLRTSVAIGLALNPGLPVLLIRDGSLLDLSNLEAVAAMAESSGAQLWIERVGDGEEMSVVIEDGSVRGALAEQQNEHAVAQLAAEIHASNAAESHMLQMAAEKSSSDEW